MPAGGDLPRPWSAGPSAPSPAGIVVQRPVMTPLPSPSYVPLWTKTPYSFLEGASTAEELFEEG